MDLAVRERALLLLVSYCQECVLDLLLYLSGQQGELAPSAKIYADHIGKHGFMYMY